jgi:hypothetical protein
VKEVGCCEGIVFLFDIVREFGGFLFYRERVRLKRYLLFINSILFMQAVYTRRK